MATKDRGRINMDHVSRVSAERRVGARDRHRIDLIGPPRPHATLQTRTGGLDLADFAVDSRSSIASRSSTVGPATSR